MGFLDRPSPSTAQIQALGNGTFAPLPAASRNPLTGMFHCDGYGAKVDGTTNDTTAIQAALTAAAAVGGTAYLPAVGSMVATVTQLVIGSNVRLLLAAGVTLQQRANTDNNLFANTARTASRSFTGGAITATAATLVASGANFTSGDVGKPVVVWGAGTFGLPLRTTISSVTNGTTAVLAANAATTVTGQSVSVGPRDSNITIEGQPGAVIDRQSNGGASGVAQHAIIMRRVDGFRSTGLTIKGSGGKYAFAIGDATNVFVDHINFNQYASDGVHLEGPLLTAEVSEITGFTHDDSVATSTSNWPGYDDVAGDITNVTIRQISTTSDASPVHVITGTGGATRVVRISDIFGATTHSGGNLVAVGDDNTQTVTTGGLLDDVEIRNVSGRLAGAGAYVAISASVCGRILVDGVDVNSTSQVYGAVFLPVTSPTVHIESLTIRNVRVASVGANSNVLAMGPGATIDSLIFDGLTGRWYGSIINPGSNCTISRCVLSKIVGVATSGGGSILDTYSSTGVTIPTVELSDSNVSGLAWLAAHSGTTEFHLSNVTANQNNGLFYATASGAITVSSHGCKFSGTTTVTLAAGGTLRARGGFFPVDFSTTGLTKQAGDTAYNTNAGLSCGAGPAVSNGTNWKGLYSGTTY